MYENLLSLPYFQGMSKDDITSILDKVTIEFSNYSDGDIICRRGESCNRFVILTQGEAVSHAESPDSTYCLIEEMHAPFAIEPYSLFGKETVFKREYTAKGSCTTLSIDKQFLFGELAKHQIFTINLLNLISHRAQTQNRIIWTYTPSSIKGRIARFVSMRCNSFDGTKHLQIKMERLASLLCETRLNISKALNELKEEGLIELQRKEITIPSLKNLIEGIKE